MAGCVGTEVQALAMKIRVFGMVVPLCGASVSVELDDLTKQTLCLLRKIYPHRTLWPTSMYAEKEGYDSV